MQRLGMVYEECARQHAKRWGVFEDIELYGFLISEWKKNIE